MTNLTKKVCQKLSFSARIAKLTLKSAFFENFFKKIQWTHRMKCCPDNLAESCSLEVRETFLIGVGKSLKIYSFYFLYLPQSFLMDSLEAIMLNLPINNCHCPEKIPLSSVVMYSIFFFTNENLWIVPLDKRISVFPTPPAFLPKFRIVFADRCELFIKLYKLKQIVSLKSMLWTFREQLWQLWRKSCA